MMKKNKKQSQKIFFTLLFFGMVVFFGGSADQARAVTFNLNCFSGPPCPSANTINFSAEPTKTTYSPGEKIFISAVLSSDDHPEQEPFRPFLSVRIDGGSGAGNVLPVSYSAQDLRSGADALVDSGKTAPMTPGAHVFNFWLSMNQAESGWFYQAIPSTPDQFNVPFTVVVAPQGTINVTSNIAGANYTITGPATITGSGISTSYPNEPTGSYIITWGDVAGYTTPATSAFVLTDGGTVNFSGNYTAIPAPTINVRF